MEGQRAIYVLKVQQLTRTLAQDRGDGERTGRGVACGRFLGAAGFEVPSLIDDVKFLSVLNSREESQRLPALEGLQEEVRTGIENQMTRSEGVPIRLSDVAVRTQEGFRFAEEVVR